VPEPFFEDFQDQAFEKSQFFFAEQQDKCPCSFCAYYFLIYSIVCRNCIIGISLHAPMLENY
jgi:hypothetical protein